MGVSFNVATMIDGWNAILNVLISAQGYFTLNFSLWFIGKKWRSTSFEGWSVWLQKVDVFNLCGVSVFFFFSTT